MNYIVKFGKYYLAEFYTSEDKPSLKFISSAELTSNIKHFVLKKD